MSRSYTSSPPQAPPWRVEGLLYFYLRAEGGLLSTVSAVIVNFLNKLLTSVSALHVYNARHISCDVKLLFLNRSWGAFRVHKPAARQSGDSVVRQRPCICYGDGTAVQRTRVLTVSACRGNGEVFSVTDFLQNHLEFYYSLYD
jgi:hypothetical protein